MATWAAVSDGTKPMRHIDAATYGEAIEAAFPAVCAQVRHFNAAWFNTQPHGPLVLIDADTGDCEVWRVVLVRDASTLAERVAAFAELAEVCADDLDDIEDEAEHRAARWARKCFDDIATEALHAARQLERIADGDWE